MSRPTICGSGDEARATCGTRARRVEPGPARPKLCHFRTRRDDQAPPSRETQVSGSVPGTWSTLRVPTVSPSPASDLLTRHVGRRCGREHAKRYSTTVESAVARWDALLAPSTGQPRVRDDIPGPCECRSVATPPRCNDAVSQDYFRHLMGERRCSRGYSRSVRVLNSVSRASGGRRLMSTREYPPMRIPRVVAVCAALSIS